MSNLAAEAVEAQALLASKTKKKKKPLPAKAKNADEKSGFFSRRKKPPAPNRRGAEGTLGPWSLQALQAVVIIRNLRAWYTLICLK